MKECTQEPYTAVVIVTIFLLFCFRKCVCDSSYFDRKKPAKRSQLFDRVVSSRRFNGRVSSDASGSRIRGKEKNSSFTLYAPLEKLKNFFLHHLFPPSISSRSYPVVAVRVSPLSALFPIVKILFQPQGSIQSKAQLKNANNLL